MQGGNDLRLAWTLRVAEKMQKRNVLEAASKLERGPNMKGMRLRKTLSKLISMIHYFKPQTLTYGTMRVKHKMQANGTKVRASVPGILLIGTEALTF